ncbi:hypothetical protein ACO9S2_09865 [Nitrospira sp. NS4]|uniref:hypothetical protein n=1 Tax=Nitrospira sp. NS4 TaxID=3414498 RepID=UPI003C2FF0DC
MLRNVCLGLAGCASALVMVSGAWALQSGGVEIGDLQTGSVVGQAFKELPVDLDIYATEVGALKILYPPTAVLDLKNRPGTPVLMRVTNKSGVERGFHMTAAENQSAPTVLNVMITLKPGETKYIGIPTSDLLYAAGVTFSYKDHLNPKEPDGKLVLIK